MFREELASSDKGTPCINARIEITETEDSRLQGGHLYPLNDYANIFHGPTRVAWSRVGSVFAISGNNDTGYYRLPDTGRMEPGGTHGN